MASCATCGQPIPDVEFGITVDDRRNSILVDGEERHLAPRLIQIIKALIDAKGAPLSKTDIEELLYETGPGRKQLTQSPVVAVFISKLRGHLRPLGFDVRAYYRSGYALERFSADYHDDAAVA